MALKQASEGKPGVMANQASSGEVCVDGVGEVQAA